MRPPSGEVLHFSEDPTIRRFVPHVAATAHEREALVWAVGSAEAPDYWFPGQCPRAMAWALPTSTQSDRQSVLGPCTSRVHAIEYAWIDRLRTTRLFAYRFPAASFSPIGAPTPHAFVSREPVEPLGPPEFVGDLVGLHEAAGIELRVLENLWCFWRAVTASTLGFSGIRAAPRQATVRSYQRDPPDPRLIAGRRHGRPKGAFPDAMPLRRAPAHPDTGHSRTYCVHRGNGGVQPGRPEQVAT